MSVEPLTDKAPDELDTTLPAAGDNRSEGDDHLRLIKDVIKTTFANVSGAITSDHDDLNRCDVTTEGTTAASEVVTADSSGDVIFSNNVTINGNTTIGDAGADTLDIECQDLEMNSVTAAILMDMDGSDHVRRITCNDGGGNFNIRSGVKYDSVSAREEYTHTGYGAAEIVFTTDSADGVIILAVADTGTAGNEVDFATGPAIEVAAGQTKARMRSAGGSFEVIATETYADAIGIAAGTAYEMNPIANNTHSGAQAHALGAIPTMVKVELECLIAEHGWVAGERCAIGYNQEYPTTSGRGIYVGYNGTNLYVKTSNTAAAYITHKTANTTHTITLANWKLVVTPYKIG